MTREDLAKTLENIAQLLELKGENPFKVRAYRGGAEVVNSFAGDIVQKAKDDDLKGIKGIGDALQQKLHELASTGKLEYYENLKSEFPDTIFELFSIQGLGPKKVKAVYEQLDVDSVVKLKEAAESGAIAGLSGFGKKSAEKILEAIEFRETNAERFRLGDVADPVEMILDALKSHPDCLRCEAAGSYRRSKETVHDIDILVATDKPESIMRFFVDNDWTESVLVDGGTKSSIRIADGLQVDLRAVSNAEYACALAYFTGSKEHNVAMRGRALSRGYTLNEYRLAPKEGSDREAPDDFQDESALYEFLGLDFIPPEMRENTGEIEAAEEGELPKLIERENLRGTFHNHTTASDGRNTLAEMGDAAIELGLQYLGIADHSKSSFQANGLDEERLRSQMAEIADLNAKYTADGVKFRIFSGSEVDILRDGSLDFEDDLMAELDYTVASVHNAMTLSESEMTKRILSAVENPHVTMLGHLTGRLLLKRDPYAVNVSEIIDACVETGTIIELNCNPWRLDMDWRWWKHATEQGVKCSINPDAHRCSDLQFLHFGIQIARKGWLTRENVVNCLPLGEVEELLERA
ncbi:MAG: DNA polymerase/3'-5' exonuclease PolX [Verrucomicrobiales bacterium]|nr:DNA polymerase/3'-5' exonuclease PolX [Verrucomicrobiales bacterium]